MTYFLTLYWNLHKPQCMSFHNIRIISAGAGSGKTYRLTKELTELLINQQVRPDAILATTFTRKAAAELQERVRVNLLQNGLRKEAELLNNALIGTVHGLGVKLLQRFAFEAGVSPAVSIIVEEDQQILFNQSLANVLTEERVQKMDTLCQRLSLQHDNYDWRKELMKITEVARANAFNENTLLNSAILSIQSYSDFLGLPAELTAAEWNNTLQALAEEAIQAISNNNDNTKATLSVIGVLKKILRDLSTKQELSWADWAKISKLKPGAKSRELIEPVADFAQKHDTHQAFHDDIKTFTTYIFELASIALSEYEAYKKQRGLIDYTDMEVLVNSLLDQPDVKEILRDELDLLIVDEFQDTSPIQLSIFLKLASVTNQSIWVGDPKQSIYGFRGADPVLMKGVLDATGGIRPDDIQKTSWRSREDIVWACNAIFVKAFPDLPPEQIALIANRNRLATAQSQNEIDEPAGVELALQHWHMKYEPEEGSSKRHPGKPWLEKTIAIQIKKILDKPPLVLPKGEKNYRQLRPGDIAVLCTTNTLCEMMAEALHRIGLEAAISRAGLLDTREARLICAALKYLLNPYDSLALAEILVLAENIPLEQVLHDRLHFLDNHTSAKQQAGWASQFGAVECLNGIRSQTFDLASSETLEVVLNELSIRNLCLRWGKGEQRLNNIERMRQMALQYEEACNRLHTAASLGGFLWWLENQRKNKQDRQGAGERPEAINVLTYHRSKGLEWPMVICHNLDRPLRADVWGLTLQNTNAGINLQNILANRWLRYWINPYHKQFRKTNLHQRIEISEAQKERQVTVGQEDARLLYVGLTRARDYLVFPTYQGQPSRWLNRIWHHDDDIPTLDSSAESSPWIWDHQILPIKTVINTFPRLLESGQHIAQPYHLISPPEGKTTNPPLPYFIDENRNQTERIHLPFTFTIHAVQTYKDVFDTVNEPMKSTLGVAIKDILTSWSSVYSSAIQHKIVQDTLQMHPDILPIDSHIVVEAMQAYQQFLVLQFPNAKSYRKYPIHHPKEGRHFRTVLDVLLETDNGLIIIQHTTFSGALKQQKKHAQQYGTFFYMTSQALQVLFPGKPIQMFLHFPLEATLLEVSANATLF